jgi:hypothetical protein
VRDALKEAETFRIEYQCGILSPQTWSQRRGLDYDQEQSNWREHAAAQPPVQAPGQSSHVASEEKM